MSLYDNYPKDKSRKLSVKVAGIWQFSNFPDTSTAFSKRDGYCFYKSDKEFALVDGKINNPANLMKYGSTSDILVRAPNGLHFIITNEQYKNQYADKPQQPSSRVVSSRQIESQKLLQEQSRKARAPLSNTERPVLKRQVNTRPPYNPKDPQGSRY